MKIVGIGYKKGVGKNTLAKFMTTYLKCERPDLNIKELSFAAKLKDIAFQLYGWAGMRPGQYYENHREAKEKGLPELGLTPRGIWIELGNNIRKIYGMTWVDYALKSASADILIITDVRFRNEAQAIRSQGGKLIKIVRDEILQGSDPAEIDLDDWKNWDHMIFNNYSLRTLNGWAEKLAKELL